MIDQYLNWEEVWIRSFRIVTLRLTEAKSDQNQDGLQKENKGLMVTQTVSVDKDLWVIELAMDM